MHCSKVEDVKDGKVRFYFFCYFCDTCTAHFVDNLRIVLTSGPLINCIREQFQVLLYIIHRLFCLRRVQSCNSRKQLTGQLVAIATGWHAVNSRH